MPLSDFSVPFSITSAVYSGTPLAVNSTVVFPSGEGRYLLDPARCQLNVRVRSKKDDVPQADGSILHCRFVTGMEMVLAVEMWGKPDALPACDTLLREMVDEFMGYMYGLLNAGDNEGRVVWTPDGAGNRMLEDARLLVYPVESQEPGGPYTLGVVLDTVWPYAADETQLAPSLSGGAGTVVNNGNRPTYPVWQIWGPFDSFTLTDTTSSPNQVFKWDQGLPGAGAALTSADYIEIDTFANSVTKIEPGPVLSNVAAGMVMTESEFFSCSPGSTSITVVYTGGNTTNNNSSRALINAAWA